MCTQGCNCVPKAATVYQIILDAIERDGLLEQTRRAGAALAAGLEALQAAHPDKLSNSRGVGTFRAFDAAGGEAARGALMRGLQARGIWAGSCGEASIRLRPALIFTPAHAEIFLNPLPWPGNGDHPKTPLSRLTPNLGENRPDFMPGTPPQHACATLLR